MKLRHYRITFRNNLTKAQEDILTGHIKGMLEDMEAKYRKGQKSFRENAILRGMLGRANKAALQLIQTKLDALLVEVDGRPLFYSYYSLEKKGDGCYVFSGPDADELLGAEALLAAFPPKLIKTFKYLLTGEKDAMMKFLNGICGHVGFKPEEYRIEIVE